MARPGSRDGINPDADQSKPKRVRTGCLTCRERHLKCDEAMPDCQNCRKSSRACRRGIRLNFMYIDCREPPVLLRSEDNWSVRFEDDSREIADEYKGGLRRSRPYDEIPTGEPAAAAPELYDRAQSRPGQLQIVGAIAHVHPATYGAAGLGTQPVRRHPNHHYTSSQSDSGYGSSNMALLSASSYAVTELPPTPTKVAHRYIESPYEALFMQVYIEEVAVWMDSLDPEKHFSRVLPFQAMEMGEPMLRNAMLACGAQHMWLVNENYREATAQQYYHAAVEAMLARLDRGDNDRELCAVTGSILSVYCIMCETPLQRLSDIAANKALIEQLKWNAKTTGVGGACFWLNVGMDILSRLAFNSPLTASLDKWELNLDFQDRVANQSEEVWTHRIMYLIAKVGHFRATAPARTQQVSPQREEVWLRQRYDEWCELRHWAEKWDESIPRSMHPLSYLEPGVSLSQKTWNQSGSRSTFPEVYLPKRMTVVARLFYHTTMVLLAQTNPFVSAPGQFEEMRRMQNVHATLICGIVAHTKDRGVASVAIRSLAIAAECITELDKRIEITQIFDQILKHTGWRLGNVTKQIQKGWGWADGVPAHTDKDISTADWPSTTTVVDGQHYSLQDGMQMLQELVVQAEADPLPIPPSRQPFRLKPRPSTSQVPVTQQPQQVQPQPQIPMPQPHQTPLMRAPQASPSQMQGHHDHRLSMPNILQSVVPSGSGYGLSASAVQNYYLPPTLGQAGSDLQYNDNSLGNLNVSQGGMQGLNGYNY